VAYFGPRRSEDSLPAGGRVRRHRPGRRRRRTELYRGLARKGLTLHQLIVEHLQGHAHYRLTGSFEQIADELQLWFDQDGADRLVLSFNNGAAGVHGFIEHVVPRIQDCGLFRRDYMGSTPARAPRSAHPGLTARPGWYPDPSQPTALQPAVALGTVST